MPKDIGGIALLLWAIYIDPFWFGLHVASNVKFLLIEYAIVEVKRCKSEEEKCPDDETV